MLVKKIASIFLIIVFLTTSVGVTYHIYNCPVKHDSTISFHANNSCCENKTLDGCCDSKTITLKLKDDYTQVSAFHFSPDQSFGFISAVFTDVVHTINVSGYSSSFLAASDLAPPLHGDISLSILFRSIQI
jgi:hypothetical protein